MDDRPSGCASRIKRLHSSMSLTHYVISSGLENLHSKEIITPITPKMIRTFVLDLQVFSSTLSVVSSLTQDLVA